MERERINVDTLSFFIRRGCISGISAAYFSHYVPKNSRTLMAAPRKPTASAVSAAGMA